jgi:hypothetical protein
MMLDHAAERRANASIGVRYDAGALAAAKHSRLCDGGRTGGNLYEDVAGVDVVAAGAEF